MLENHKDQHWEEAQGSMDKRVKMRTDDQSLHLGWPAEENRMRDLEALAGRSGDVRWHLRPEDSDGPCWKVTFSSGLCSLGSLSLWGQGWRHIKYKARPISCKVFALVIETGSWTALRTLVMGWSALHITQWGMLPHCTVEKGEKNFREGQSWEEFFHLHIYMAKNDLTQEIKYFSFRSFHPWQNEEAGAFLCPGTCLSKGVGGPWGNWPPSVISYILKEKSILGGLSPHSSLETKSKNPYSSIFRSGFCV